MKTVVMVNWFLIINVLAVPFLTAVQGLNFFTDPVEAPGSPFSQLLVSSNVLESAYDVFNR